MSIQQVFPYLRVDSAEAAIAFYEKAFGAIEVMRLTEPNGRIGHAEVKLGETTIMLSDEFPEYGILGPVSLGGTTFSIHLHLDNVDEAHARAVDAGAKELMAPKDQFYGERSSKLKDPFGHEWLLGSEIEKVSAEEMQRRYTEIMTPTSE